LFFYWDSCTVFFNGGPITWVSHKQQFTTSSTTKIEYVDVIMATKEIVWLRRLLANLGYSQSTPTMFLLNNQIAIRLGSNLEFHCHTKHIDIQYHIIHQSQECQSIHFQYVSTHDQIVDVLTKALHVDKFQ
jgi:phage antirepressor YoqD-like protein